MASCFPQGLFSDQRRHHYLKSRVLCPRASHSVFVPGPNRCSSLKATVLFMASCFPQGLFSPPKTRPWVFRRAKRPVSIENLGIACGHSRRVFFRPQKHAPGFFGGQKSPFLTPGTRRPLPGGAHIKTDPANCFGI